MAEALHFDCILCQNDASGVSPNEATTILLTMILTGSEPLEIVKDMCFVHRRHFEDTLKRIEQDPAS